MTGEDPGGIKSVADLNAYLARNTEMLERQNTPESKLLAILLPEGRIPNDLPD